MVSVYVSEKISDQY